jgi:hypothetical protein
MRALVAIGALASLLVRPAVQVSRAPDGAGVAVHIEAVLRAPLCSVEAVLLDAPGYTGWFPSTQSVRVLTRERDAVLFETLLKLPWPVRDVRETVWLERRARARAVTIGWRQQRGDLLRNQGRWTLNALDSARTRVSYDAIVQTRVWVPAWLVRIASERQGPRLMRGLEARAQARASCT